MDTAELDLFQLVLVAVALEWVPLVLKAEEAFQVSEAADGEKAPLAVMVDTGEGSLLVSAAVAVAVEGVHPALIAVAVAEETLQALGAVGDAEQEGTVVSVDQRGWGKNLEAGGHEEKVKVADLAVA